MREGVNYGGFKKRSTPETAKAILNLIKSIKLCNFYYSKAEYLSKINFAETKKQYLFFLILLAMDQKLNNICKELYAVTRKI